MRTKKTNLNQLCEIYSHPSIAFFRAIELKAIHESCKNMDFKMPSLDLGCGDGRIAELLFDEKFTYGLDNGEAKDIEIAKGMNRYEKLLVEDARKISLKDEAVNFVFSNCVIEHIPKVEQVISEISRILKPGGDFVYTTPSHNFSDYLFISNLLKHLRLATLVNIYICKRNQMLHHHNMHSHQQWEEKLKKHNLKMTKFRYYMTKEALMLWDKMALEIFIGKKVSKKTEQKVFWKYFDQMEKLYSELVKNDKGGAVLIIARKI